MSAPQLKFSYFNIAGRGELSRLIFTYANVAFTDDRVVNFPELKPKCPFGQLPLLEVDGTMYSQSMAIARYAARVGGLYPENPVDALRVDMISETLSEILTAYIGAFFHEKNATLKVEKFKKLVEETAPKAFGVLETMVQGKFFLGDKASYADVQLLDVVLNGLNTVPEQTFNLAAFPKLEAIVAAVKTNEYVAAYLAAKH
uniref:Glutathione S-transferase n=1 Tax=Globisporangium ultimum (strain ATCC 200006 / CBS 805.95 / DAOM BR144) TaxID=431595 RepID=K3WK14_GLOUD